MVPEGKGFPYYSPSKAQFIGQPCEVESSQKAGDVSVVSPGIKGSGNDARESADERMEDNDTICDKVGTASVGDDSQSHSRRQWELTNSNVRRQIIRPWEDPAGQNGMVSPPESSLDSTLSTSSKATKSGANSVQTAAEALVAMASPTKEAQEEETMAVDNDRNNNRASRSPPKRNNRASKSPLKSCGRKRSVSLALTDVCNGVRGPSKSPPTTRQAQVSIDGRSLVELFERIVKGTDCCSVEEMERIHTTYRQLVFRHRMSWERQGLLEVSGGVLLFDVVFLILFFCACSCRI